MFQEAVLLGLKSRICIKFLPSEINAWNDFAKASSSVKKLLKRKEARQKMKIAVVGGAGAMGSGIVRDLLSIESEGVRKAIVLELNAAKAKQNLSELLEDDRLQIKAVDARNREEISKVLKEVDACANAGPYTIIPDIMNACLDAECHYTDLGTWGHVTMQLKEELHEKFIEKNISAILGMGNAPGMTNILARYGVDRLDTVEKANVYWAAKYFGPESLVFVPPYHLPTICLEYSTPYFQYLDGGLESVFPADGKQTVMFPEPIGKAECVFSVHPEPTTMSYSFKNKGIKEATWRLSPPEFVDKTMKALIAVGFGDEEPLEINGVKIVPSDFLEALTRRNIEKNKEKITEPEEKHDIHRAAVEGEKEGGDTRWIIDCIGSGGTGINASIGVQMLARGEIKPGVWFPEECVNTKKYIEEMKKRNFKVTVLREEAL